jgi:hypothetical protein
MILHETLFRSQKTTKKKCNTFFLILTSLFAFVFSQTCSNTIVNMSGTLQQPDNIAAAHVKRSPIKITTSKGVLRGYESCGVANFRGVRFAKAPVGDLRFKAPEDIDAWGESDRVRHRRF